MGEAGRGALRVGFDRTLELELHNATVTSAGGLLPSRDLHDPMQFTELAAGVTLPRFTYESLPEG